MTWEGRAIAKSVGSGAAGSMGAPSSAYDRVVALLEARHPRPSQSGNFCCPAHDDRTPSLAVKRSNGKILLRCHAGCETASVVEALGLSMTDLFDPEPDGVNGGAQADREGETPPKPWRFSDSAIEAVYEYTPDLQLVRISAETRERLGMSGKVRPRHRVGNRWFHTAGPWRGRVVPLYREAEAVAALQAGGRLFLVEGEKDVEAIRSAGEAATCNAWGAGSFKEEHAARLAEALGRTGGRVVIVEDRDKSGEKHVRDVRDKLVAAGVGAEQVSIVLAKAGKDAADHLDAGFGLDEFVPVGPAGDYVIEWAAPEAVPDTHEPVEDVDSDLLPEPIRAYVVEHARNLCVPLGYVALPLMAAAGVAIGRRCGIAPEEHGNWYELPNVWAAIVGDPGSTKSPALALALEGLRAIDVERIGSWETTERSRAVKIRALRAEQKGIEQKIQGLYKRDNRAGDIEEQRAALQQELENVDEEIVQTRVPQPRLLTSDATPEKITELLRDNPNGIGIDRDELHGWVQSLERDYQTGARQFFLEAWTGKQGHVSDRIGRGTTRVAAACVGVLGGFQPATLAPLVQEAVRDGGGDGLLQRFLVFWPDSLPPFAKPVSETAGTMAPIFRRLVEIESSLQGVRRIADVPVLGFTAEAQRLFDEWRLELETELRRPEAGDCPAFTGHRAKMRKNLPAFALIDHLLTAGNPASPVSLVSLQRAADWIEILIGHIRKVYASELQPERVAARKLVDRIREGKVKDGMSVRDLQRRDWSGLNTSAALHDALDILVRHHWLQREREVTGGRPTETIRLHPTLIDPRTTP